MESYDYLKEESPRGDNDLFQINEELGNTEQIKKEL